MKVSNEVYDIGLKYFDDDHDLTETMELLKQIYPELSFNYDSVKKGIQRARMRKDEAKVTKEVESIPDRLIRTLKSKQSKEDLLAKLDISERLLNAHIADLKDQSYQIEEVNGMIWLEKKIGDTFDEHEHHIDGEVVKFGIISDTHLCNKWQQLTHLNTFYDICSERGISSIYHCGDLTDGYYKIRPGHIYELFMFGFDQQADYVIENYPHREDITTYFLTGNHDDTHIKNGGANIGPRIARDRPDMQYLGLNFAKVWLTPTIDMDLIHPIDGTSYALSYKLQKRIDALQGGNKPKMLFTGHYHKQCNMLYRNIHAFMVPCFEAQTPFMRGKALASTVGGLIITLVIKDDEIKSITPEFINFYKMLENDY